jgi:small subunit ribosomal protein S16
LIRIRLQRKGRKKRPFYHVVAADQRAPRDGRVIERLGRFDNVSENKIVELNEDRILHWLQIGAQPSDTVRSILKNEGILYKMHLRRWGKSDEEIAAALEQWKEERSARKGEKAVSRKERQKELLASEEKAYKEELQKKAAEAAKEAERKKAEEAAKKAEEQEASAEEPKQEAEAVEEVEEKVEAEEPQAEAAVAETPAVEETEEPEEPKSEEKTVKPEEPSEDAKAEEKTEAPSPAETKSDAAESTDDAKEGSAEKVSTDLTAADAIDHIKNNSIDDLKGFVTDKEERVTVQRAWESKQAE